MLKNKKMNKCKCGKIYSNQCTSLSFIYFKIKDFEIYK